LAAKRASDAVEDIVAVFDGERSHGEAEDRACGRLGAVGEFAARRAAAVDVSS
jgi:hypothetical protein